MPRPPRSLWPARLAWTAGVVGFLIASAYAIGGPRVFRFRARAAALLEPPTAAQMAADTLSQSMAPAIIPGNEPMSLVLMLAWTAAIVLGVLVLLLVSARWRR